MKKLIFLLAIGLGLVTASAQQYKLTTLMGGYATNIVAVQGVSNYGSDEFEMACTKYGEVAVQIKYQCDAASDSSNVVFTFTTSADGTTYDTGKKFSVARLSNGETAVQLTTNFTVGNAGYFKLHSIDAGDCDAVMTNIVIKVATKPKRNG